MRKNWLSNPLIIVSVITGSFFGLITYIILIMIEPEIAFVLSWISGLLFCILLLWTLVIASKINEKRYLKFEKNINFEIFYKTNGNFTTANGIINGNIYFCERGIVFVSLDKKPYAVDEVLLENIQRYEIDNTHINIYTKDWKKYFIVVPDANNVLQILKEKHWIE